MIKFTSVQVTILAFLAGFSVACSTGSQILPVTPKVNVVDQSPRGISKTLSLKVSDSRDTNVVGYRDPTDPQSAITSAPETLENIKRKLLAAYTDLGYTLVETSDAADIAMHVELTELSYQRQTDGVIKDLRTGATFNVTSVMSDRTVTGTYRDGQGKDTVIAPSRSANAEILNMHIDKALSKLVADRRLTSEDW